MKMGRDWPVNRSIRSLSPNDLRVLRSGWLVGKPDTTQASVGESKIAPTPTSPRPRQLFSGQFADNYLPLAHNGSIVSFTPSAGRGEIAGTRAKSWELKAKSSRRNARNSFAVYSL
jgi:hypothetical protein